MVYRVLAVSSARGPRRGPTSEAGPPWIYPGIGDFDVRHLALTETFGHAERRAVSFFNRPRRVRHPAVRTLVKGARISVCTAVWRSASV